MSLKESRDSASGPRHNSVSLSLVSGGFRTRPSRLFRSPAGKDNITRPFEGMKQGVPFSIAMALSCGDIAAAQSTPSPAPTMCAFTGAPGSNL